MPAKVYDISARQACGRRDQLLVYVSAVLRPIVGNIRRAADDFNDCMAPRELGVVNDQIVVRATPDIELRLQNRNNLRASRLVCIENNVLRLHLCWRVRLLRG